MVNHFFLNLLSSLSQKKKKMKKHIIHREAASRQPGDYFLFTREQNLSAQKPTYHRLHFDSRDTVS
jgi:hypothetical protein